MVNGIGAAPDAGPRSRAARSDQVGGVDGDLLAVEQGADGLGHGQAAAYPPGDVGALPADRAPLGGGVAGAEAEPGPPARQQVEGGHVRGEQVGSRTPALETYEPRPIVEVTAAAAASATKGDAAAPGWSAVEQGVEAGCLGPPGQVQPARAVGRGRPGERRSPCGPPCRARAGREARRAAILLPADPAGLTGGRSPRARRGVSGPVRVTVTRAAGGTPRGDPRCCGSVSALARRRASSPRRRSAISSSAARVSGSATSCGRRGVVGQLPRAAGGPRPRGDGRSSSRSTGTSSGTWSASTRNAPASSPVWCRVSAAQKARRGPRRPAAYAGVVHAVAEGQASLAEPEVDLDQLVSESGGARRA